MGFKIVHYVMLFLLFSMKFLKRAMNNTVNITIELFIQIKIVNRSKAQEIPFFSDWNELSSKREKENFAGITDSGFWWSKPPFIQHYIGLSCIIRRSLNCRKCTVYPFLKVSCRCLKNGWNIISHIPYHRGAKPLLNPALIGVVIILMNEGV